MSKVKLKEILIFLLFGSINLAVAFSITYLFGFMNTTVISSMIYGNITWEVIIFLTLSIIEASIYEYPDYLVHF